jgi:hypothetical protein
VTIILGVELDTAAGGTLAAIAMVAKMKRMKMTLLRAKRKSEISTKVFALWRRISVTVDCVLQDCVLQFDVQALGDANRGGADDRSERG